MGHTIEAFIAGADLLRDAARGLKAACVIQVGEGLALLPNTGEPFEEARAGDGPAFDEFYKLSPGLAALGAGWSAGGPVAYVETDYWGGEGRQAAVLWERGEVVYGPAAAALGPINDVLRRMGVERRDGLDQFDVVGLGRYRTNMDWVEQPRHGARG